MMRGTPNVAALRLVAFAAMLVDHVGALLLPELVALRIVGRVAFPFFACCSGYSAENFSTDRSRHARRLALWGVLSQPVYLLAFGSPMLNVLFTLAAGVAIGGKRARGIWFAALLVGGFVEVVALDGRTFCAYGLWGVAGVACASWGWWPAVALFVAAANATGGGFGAVIGGFVSGSAVAVFVCSPVLRWSPGDWSRSRLWYWFYPAHLAALLLMR